MRRLGRDAPCPPQMQVRWRDAEDPTAELLVQGAEIACFGHAVAYDYRRVDTVVGALTVSLKTDDPADEDAFQRTHITEWVMTPEGDFLACNLERACQFERAGN